MDYLELLQSKYQNKAALITDEKTYTYGQLVAASKARREQIDYTENVHFIYADKIAEQLLQFVAYSGTKVVPVIATEASKGQCFDLSDIPQTACMGVMTSGSTGKSKLLWRSYHSWADFFPEQNRVFAIDEATIMFCQGSLSFTGNLNMYMGALAAGATLVVTEKFRPKHWLKLIEEHNVNAIYLIPSKLLLLHKCMEQANMKIKTIVSGSQSMGREEADKLKKSFPNGELTLYYGASELNYITYIKGQDMTDDKTDIGLPFKNVGVSIKNEEIFIDTPYHVENIEIPFSLKDRGMLDKNGHLHFLGRTDDIVSVNGIKVATTKVEAALMALQEIMEVKCLVFHKDDADILTAFIGGAEKISRQLLVEKLRAAELTDYEIPKQYVFMPSLPKNESGKIDKKALQNYTF